MNHRTATNRSFRALRRRIAALVLAAAVGWIGNRAQAQPAPTSAPTSAPAVVPQGITMQPGGRLLVNFRDANIDTILDELSRAAKLSIVKIVPTQGRIPALVNLSGVTVPQAVALLDAALAQLDYAAVLQGDIIKIGRVSDFKRTIVPVVQVSDADPSEKLEATDRMITAVISLRYASATQLRQDLQPLINPGADFTANASSNSLMITDSEVNIKRVVEIVKALDAHLAGESKVEVVQLKFANAQDVARLINDLFRQPAAPAQANANANPGRGNPGGFNVGNFGNRGARRGGGGG